MDTEIPTSIADRLRALNLRQVEFAEWLGVHRVSMSRWVTGAAPAPRYVIAYLDAIERIADLERELARTEERLFAVGANRPGDDGPPV